tara:strand:+ start:811 stop:1152 length:342 start_codon:yes stop_codon:yes gene_type:complete
MSNLSKKIELYLGRKPDFVSEVVLEDIGDGVVTIKLWNAEDKVEPTISQLNALNTQANTKINDEKILSLRKSAYGNIESQLDLLYHDMTAGKLDATGEWHKSIKAVKDANPKG